MTEVKLDFDKQGGLVPVIVTDYKDRTGAYVGLYE